MAGSRVGALHWDQEQTPVLADGQTLLCLGGKPQGHRENPHGPLRTP